MKLVNCKRCGKLFQYNGISQYCPVCMRYDEENFKKIKEYLYEHPKATLFQVAEDLDIPVKMIEHYLKEGRLEIVESENLFLKCEICGTSIKSGRYCDKCVRYLDSDLKKAASEAARNLLMQRERRDERMRYLNKNKIKKF
ncbi:hypothetical protein [Defluviitalea phaphyphila]|uniref:hypothetical protein n=1 Tax=Defluviitalea phaphyphila TaxID=1473580 RepID=UPI0007301F06|nr:hypothetical protein [Defluviitalea phaphyphila]